MGAGLVNFMQHNRMRAFNPRGFQPPQDIPHPQEWWPVRQMDPSSHVINQRLAPLALRCRHIMGQWAQHINLMRATAQGSNQYTDRQCGKAGKIVQIHDEQSQP
ncbi:MAG: hypothetical protein PGN34_01910 [Methylobacterium frigidaeris]